MTKLKLAFFKLHTNSYCVNALYNKRIGKLKATNSDR